MITTIHLSFQGASHGVSYDYSCDSSPQASQEASHEASHHAIYEDFMYVMNGRYDQMQYT